MNKRFLTIAAALSMGVALTACSSGGGDEGKTGGSSVANADKPLVWYNRQPSNSSTGELDMDALNFNKDTYYVGFDANQGAELQGQMIKESYVTTNS